MNPDRIASITNTSGTMRALARGARQPGALLIAALLLSACAAPVTVVPMQFAAKTDAAHYRRVAVLPFDGDGGPEATKQFESMLASVRYEQRPYFTVVDRLTLQNVLSEMNLRQSAYSNPRSAVKLGRLVGADALYSGSAFVLPIAYSHSTENRVHCPDKGKCVTVPVPCTTKTAGFKLIPRLVEVSQGKVVYSETKTGSASSYWCADSGSEVSAALLLNQAANDAFQQVREDIAPYEKNVYVNYKKDTDGIDPKSVETFEGALDFAKSGRFDRACSIWAQLVPANPSSVALPYNLAVCDEVNGRLDSALARYERVDNALTKPDADVNAALVRVRDAIAQRARLATEAKGAAHGS
ncbi:CsgG/HfaB family protein [Burkholderia sp. WSM2232]|uniref:CsgG/HfaB family protein n=1 Tax=Burkholderia sp. WSM2232 TaxID=944436 RepID=UPI0018DD8136|nr:CsgG/HfaB family protein [Burkholderia sp. WSM2232]